MNNEQVKEVVGKLAAHKQEMVDTVICMYYDEVYDIEAALEILRVDMQAAKKYRDAFFLKYNGEQLPSHTYPLTDESHEEVAQAEEQVKDLL